MIKIKIDERIKTIETSIFDLIEWIFIYVLKHIKVLKLAFFHPKELINILHNSSYYNLANYPMPLIFLIVNVCIACFVLGNVNDFSTYTIMEKMMVGEKNLITPDYIEYLFSIFRVFSGLLLFSLLIYLNNHGKDFNYIIRTICYFSAYYPIIILAKMFLGYLPLLVSRIFFLEDNPRWRIIEEMATTSNQTPIFLSVENYNKEDQYKITFGSDSDPMVSLFSQAYGKTLFIEQFTLEVVIPIIFAIFIIFTIFYAESITKKALISLKVITIAIVLIVTPFLFSIYNQYGTYSSSTPRGVVDASVEKLKNQGAYSSISFLTFLYANEQINSAPKQIQFEYLAKSTYYGLYSIIKDKQKINHITKAFENEQYEVMLDDVGKLLDEVESYNNGEYKTTTSGVKFLLDTAKKRRAEFEYFAASKHSSIGVGWNHKLYIPKIIP